MNFQKKNITNERRWFFAKLTGSIATIPIIARALSSVPRMKKLSTTTPAQMTVSINPLAVPRTNKDQA
jgi:hypothetical protein